MIKIYDIECEDCKRMFESFIEDGGFPQCPVCGGDTHRVYTTMNFKLIYNNKKDICAWSDNNYETSQYWSKVKEARERGENVKGLEEN